MSADIKEIGESDNEETPFEVTDEFQVTGWGYRHQQSLILFLTLTIAHSMRACMGVALIAMNHHDLTTPVVSNLSNAGNLTKDINSTKTIKNMETDIDADDFHVNGFFNALMLTPPYPTFKWSKKVQDMVVSSFFWGYMALQLPAGQLAHRFGARYLLAGAMLINCLLCVLLPLASFYGGWIFTIIFRILQGVAQACILPGIHTLFGKWAPLEERGRLTSFTYGGNALGTVLGIPMTGFISSSPSLGWPGVFRFSAVLSGIIGAIVFWFTADSPAEHPKISATERKYIEDGIGVLDTDAKKRLPVPWSKILTHMGVYAIVVAHIGNNWGQLTLFAELPAFMDNVIGVDIKTNGLLTALPFMVMWFTNFFFSWLTDMLIVKKVMSPTNVRKFVNSLGCIPAATGLIVLAFVPKNIYVVETLLVIICALKVSAQSGFQVNHIDISPNFAGTLMSISNFASNGAASFAPITASLILTDVKSEYLWRKVFFITAGFYLFTNLFYCIFGTAEKAVWNEPDPGSIDEDTELKEVQPILQK